MIWLTVLYAFLGCLGFCFVFQLRGISCLWASLGGALGWATYLLLGDCAGDLLRYFIATLVLAVYSEIVARRAKKPATCYLIVSIVPLVPGSGIYYTMYYCITKDNEQFAREGFHTLGIAGALAVGILVVTTASRLLRMVLRKKERS